MAAKTNSTRLAALSLLKTAGMDWTRAGRGQRFVVEIRGRKQARAVVKVASLGSAMVRTDRDDAEGAKISGFGEDVDHVFFAVGDPQGTAPVSGYLVPIEEVEAAYRIGHQAWKATHADSGENTTWVIWFNDGGVTPECNGFARKWAKYRIGPDPSDLNSNGDPRSKGPDTGGVIEEAKMLVAARLGVSPERVRIVVEY